MKVLIAVDLSDATTAVVSYAAGYLAPLAARVWLVHVTQPEPAFIGFAPGPQVVRDAVAREFRDEHHRLQAEADALGKRGVAVTPLLVQGSAADAILEEAEKLDADLIILGSHGHGVVHQLLMGSVCEDVLHRARQTVLVVPTRDRGGL